MLVFVLRTSIFFKYGILDQIFKVLDDEDVSVKEKIPFLPILSKKNMKMILLTSSKTTYLKNPNNLEKLHPDFSEEGEEEMLKMRVFSAKI